MLELFMLFCMRFHRNEVRNFNIVPMEEKSGSTNIFSFSSMVNLAYGWKGVDRQTSVS